MKVFLINMAESPQRLASADRQLRRLGVAYERVEAVNGRLLTPEERRRAVNSFRWWCAIGRPIVPAEIGCALSHATIYRHMVEEKIPYACVLEDDVVLDDRFREQLDFIAHNVNVAEAQVVLLSNHTQERHDGQAVIPTQQDMFAEGYVLTRRAAEALLRENYPMQTPCDHWGRWVKAQIIRLYHAFPTVCCQDQVAFGSTTSMGRVAATRNLSFLGYAVHKLKRVVGRTIDWALSGIERWGR